MKRRTQSLCIVSMFTVLLCLGSWITIPLVIPLTLQSFVLYCILWLLWGKKAVISVSLYLFLGAVGLPVFSGFQGGVVALFGPTGGFLLGFLLMAVLTLIKTTVVRTRIWLLIVGTILCYIFGTIWYVSFFTGWTPGGIGTALVTCVAPFLPPDAIKLVCALVLCRRLEPMVSRYL